MCYKMKFDLSAALLRRKILPVCCTLFLFFLATPLKAQTDVTSLVVNPNFDGRNFAGWQQMGLWFQTNSDFAFKDHYAYVERWVDSNTNLPDTYIKQTISSMPNGRYQLVVGAQHVKQGSSTNATGAAIFADWQETTVTTAADYTLTFDVLTGDATIGFKCVNSTANWMACDNFRLKYIGNDVAYLRTGLANMVNKAQTLAAQSMDASVKSQLSSAISTASALTTNGSATNISNAAITLKNAMKAAERSIFATKTSTTGSVPQVVTNPRYARGATMIFGRSTVSSSVPVLEQGFCYSKTNMTPTVADERTTRYVSNGGNIYCIDNLEPGSTYYIRAYAVTTAYQVGYGDVLRVYTLPKGSITWDYGNEGDDAQDNRISQAVEGGMTYWSNLTSISGFNLSAHYSYGAGAGDGTADCSYGGYMRISQNEAYQATGTVMHEAGHGIGVGTTGTYYGDIRSGNTTGIWYGKRATRLLQFWDNSDAVRLTGDGTHMWATNAAQALSYTINGAHEDAHEDAQYYANALLMQAIVEDGLFPVANQLQGLAYTLEHEDNQVFYIRNSDEGYGLKSAYLIDNGGTLLLKTLANDEAKNASNNAQWLLTFDPAKQLYRIKNKNTGRYIYYASDNVNNGFKTSASTSNEVDLRLQLSFVDVTVGPDNNQLALDAFHIMRKNATASPQALCAKTTSITGSTAFSNTNAATTQRWVFLTGDDIDRVDQAIRDAETNHLDQLIAHIRALASCPHTEKSSGAGETLETTLQDIETRKTNADAATLISLEEEAKTALMAFLGNTTPQGNPYDITFLVENADMESAEGWLGTTPAISYSCGEFYQRAFDCYQIVQGAPAGRYVFKLQAFQRPGSPSDVYNDYAAGTSTYPITTQVYLGMSSALACHIGKYAQTTKVGKGNESEVGSPVRYMPNNMEAAAAYFAKGYYENMVETTLESNNQSLRFGIRGASYVSADWTIFDNFRLYYYGGSTENQDPAAEADGYDITTAMAPYLCTGSLKDWTNNGMAINYNAGAAPYSNTADGAFIDFPFAERWVSSANGGKLSDTSFSQTITELPNGKYYIRASIIAANQAAANTQVSGVTFFAADQEMAVATGDGIPERYSFLVEVTNGTLTYGLKAQNTNANWIAIDNISLIYDGTEEEYWANGSICSPVRIPIANPTFDNWTYDGWNLNGSWGTMNAEYNHFNAPFVESWVGSAGLADRSITQTLQLPKGFYSLHAAVEAVRQDNPSLTVSGVSLRLDDEQVACHTQDGKPEIFYIEKELSKGDHTLGLYVQSTDANWVAADNFVLRYYGPGMFDKGDVNKDNNLSVVDVMMIVNYILDTNGTIDECLADINGDGDISVVDAMALVDIILSQ